MHWFERMFRTGSERREMNLFRKLGDQGIRGSGIAGDYPQRGGILMNADENNILSVCVLSSSPDDDLCRARQDQTHQHLLQQSTYPYSTTSIFRMHNKPYHKKNNKSNQTPNSKTDWESFKKVCSNSYSKDSFCQIPQEFSKGFLTIFAKNYHGMTIPRARGRCQGSKDRTGGFAPACPAMRDLLGRQAGIFAPVVLTKP